MGWAWWRNSRAVVYGSSCQRSCNNKMDGNQLGWHNARGSHRGIAARDLIGDRRPCTILCLSCGSRRGSHPGSPQGIVARDLSTGSQHGISAGIAAGDPDRGSRTKVILHETESVRCSSASCRLQRESETARPPAEQERSHTKLCLQQTESGERLKMQTANCSCSAEQSNSNWAHSDISGNNPQLSG